MKKFAIVTVFAVLSALQVSPLYAGDKLGKLFIKASSTIVDGQEFTDKAMEDTVQDMKRTADRFEIVDSEKEADYRLTIVSRGKNSFKAEIKATLSYKENGQWKPGAMLTGLSSRTWTIAANQVVKDAADWIQNRGK
jgi:hypothetical protein